MAGDCSAWRLAVFAEFVVQRCTADEHDVVVANTLLDHRVDNDLHVRHRRRQERRHAEDVRAMLLERLDVGFGVRVDAEIDHFEARPFHHHPDQVLANVMDVALDGADDHLADRLRAAG